MTPKKNAPRCGEEGCNNIAKYYLYIGVHPQRLGDGSYERSPAGRSIQVCTIHLPMNIRRLCSLPYRASMHVKVREI